MPPPDPSQLDGLISKLSPQGLQALHTAVYQAHSFPQQDAGYDQEKVGQVWDSVNRVVAAGGKAPGPQVSAPQEFWDAAKGLMTGSYKLAAEAMIPGGALFQAKDIIDQRSQLNQEDAARAKAGYSPGYRTAAAVSTLAMGVDPARAEQLAAQGSQKGVVASLGPASILALAGGLHSMFAEGPHPVEEVPQATRTTPLSATGKSVAPPTPAPNMIPELSPLKEAAARVKAAVVEQAPNPGAITSEARAKLAEARPIPDAQRIDALTREVANDSKLLRNNPDATSEERAGLQVRIQDNQAQLDKLAPPPTVQARPLQEIVQGIGPKARPKALPDNELAALVADPKASAAAGLTRNDFLAARAENARRTGSAVVKAPSTDPVGGVDTAIKRVMKASGADDLARRRGEFADVIRANFDVPPEQGLATAKLLRDRASTFAAQADEVARVAAAPAKISQMADAVNRPKLLGEWQRLHGGGEEGIEPHAIAPGEQAPFYKTVNINEVSPAERDLYHQMLGHGTAEVLTRDEGGKPVSMKVNSDAEAEGYKKYVDELKTQLQAHLEGIKNRSVDPDNWQKFVSHEELDHMAELKDQIEQYSGLRERLAVNGPRKGLPTTDEQGVVRAPGAIPDIGQRTGNALMDRGTKDTAHIKVPSPEQLRQREAALRQGAHLYDTAANALEQVHQGSRTEQWSTPIDNPSTRVRPLTGPEAGAHILERAAEDPRVVAAMGREALEGDGELRPPSTPEELASARSYLANAEKAYTQANLRGASPEKLHLLLQDVEHLKSLIQKASPGKLVPITRYDESGKAVSRSQEPAPKVPQLKETTSAALRESVDMAGLKAELADVSARLEAVGRDTPRDEIERLKATKTAYEKALTSKPATLEEDQISQRLFGKSIAELNSQERLKLSMRLQGYEKALRPERPAFEPATSELKKPFSAGFPDGLVSDDLRSRVEQLSGLLEPNGVSMIGDAVRRQGLGSREGAYKLMGKALKAYAKGGTDALADALSVANRDGERGAMSARFFQDLGQALHDRLTPGKTPLSPKEATKQTLREEGASRAQYLARITNSISKLDKIASKWTPQEGTQLQKDIQSGDWRTKYAPKSAPYKVAQLTRDILDENRRNIQQAAPGRLKTFEANYMPQRWEGIHDMSQYRVAVKAPLRGRGTLLQEKYYQTIDAGEQAGLKLAEPNPLRAAINAAAEGAHFVMGQRIIDDMRGNGLMKQFRSPRNVPADWAPLDMKVAGAGKYAPGEIARMFNNYFDPGIFAKNRTLDSIRIYNNAAQIAAVSLSGYHMGLTAFESFATDLSLGLKYMSFDPAKAFRAWGRAAYSPIDSMLRGNKFMREYRNTSAMNMSNTMRGYIEGGNRLGISKLADTSPYKQAQRGFVRAIRANDYHAAGNAALQFIPDTLRMLSVPVQDWWVPRMKAGATVKMIEMELDRLGPGATDLERKAAMREVADSADNRFGQMVTDNLFWNKTLRDSATLGFKFIDFNYGSLREMYGAAKDIPRAAVGGGLSHRLAHALAFPVAIAISGGIMNYMLTGEAPKEAEDYYFPRNGRTGADGKPERVMLPSYLRTAYELGSPAVDAMRGQPGEAISDTATVARGRMSPIANLMKSFVDNRDFLGNTVINKNDPVISRLGSFLGAIIRQAQPISMGSYERSEQLGGSMRDKALAVAGVQPVPRSLGIDQSPAELELTRQLREFAGSASPTTLAHERAINQLVAAQRNDPSKFSGIWQKEVAAGHLNPDKDMDTVMARMTTPYLESGMKRLPLSQAVSVLEAADNPRDRALAMQSISDKLDALWEMPAPQREALWNRIVQAQKQGK